ncbi:MAG: peptidylprolyl isomerase [candidate division WOR-3 bacterium]|nr:peptidylprolyl isomerase [candidate division WOR-3 bacterium]MCX7836440.1 peptidylprolyl isomerase [candidate division WOR-3 bacterium]MDW8114214.1 peptidylprolyl isomerase [candidate division WOR-3 bacterium]
MIYFLILSIFHSLSYDYIIAYVDEEVILYSEFQKSYLLLKEFSPQISDTLALKDSLLNSLINGKILLKEAEKETIIVKERELENFWKERLERIKENFLTSETLLEKMEEFLKNNLRQELIIQKLLSKKNRLNITVTPLELKEFYEKVKDSLARKPAICEIAHIFLPILPSEEKEKNSQRRISEIYEILLRGGDFEEICRNFSDDKNTKDKGGYLGEFLIDSLPLEFQEALKKLKVDEFSSPFRSQYGYHIVKKLGEAKNKIKIAHIFVKVPISREDTLAARNLLLKIREKALRGEDFAKLAKKYSYDLETKEKGGYLGEFIINFLFSPFKEVCENLDSGEISLPVLSKDGFHLIKMLRKEKERVFSFLEIQEELRNFIYQKRLKEIIDEYLREVRENHFIKINI